MSSGALFGNTAARGASKNLVEFKAGKMTMKGKMVYPDNRKGQLYVYQSDDSLMHFCWKDRTTGVVEDDLIIFPDDCEFKHVSQCKTGRVYLLRFKSSSRKFFFWLQDLKTDKDEEHCRKINEVLNNPPTPSAQRVGGANSEGDLQNLLNNMSQQQLMQLFGGVGQIGSLSSLLGTMNRPFSGNRMSSTSSSLSPATTTASRPPASATPSPATATATATAPTTTAPTAEAPKTTGNSKTSQSTRTTEPSAPIADNNRIRLSDLQNFLSGIPTPLEAEPSVQKVVVTELCSTIPAAISAISASESLEGAMSEHLPPGDSLSTTLSSPQFSQALSMFWSALQSGQAAPVVQQFGLGNDLVNAAANGSIEQFVNALESEVKAKTTSEPGTTEQQQQQQQQESSTSEQTKAQQPQQSQQPQQQQQQPKSSGKDKKKDDDDEGMALD